jgi:hypothetical protein
VSNLRRHFFWAACWCAVLTPGISGAAGNPGRSAMECVTPSRDKGDVVFHNQCDYKIFVVWCGDLKYSKKRCGDGPAGSSFYTHSNNIAPGGTMHAWGVGDYKFAACEGGIAFDKAPIQDQPDGSFACLPGRRP